MSCTGPGQNPGELCGRKSRAYGLCDAHRTQQVRNGELKPIRLKGSRPCSHVDADGTACTRPRWARGLCRGHDRRRAKGLPMDGPIRTQQPGRVCEVDGCGKPHRAKGLCAACWKKANPPEKPKAKTAKARRKLDKPCPCGAKVYAKGLCRPCYRVSDLCPRCAFDGCGQPRDAASGLCGGHEKQRLKGDVLRPLGIPVSKPVPKRPEPVVEPWDPAELKHATTAARKRPRPDTGYTREIGRVDPPTEAQVAAIRRLCGDLTDSEGNPLVEYLLGVAS